MSGGKFLKKIQVLKKMAKYYLPKFIKRESKFSAKFLLYGSTYALFNKKTCIEQSKLLSRESWDILIILDACRYDYFRDEYEKFLSGELIKVWSPASGTTPWLKKTFGGYYPDIQVFSATPFINSKGIDLLDYNATKHFPPKNIIDIWDFGWDDKLKTVHPKTVVETVLSYQIDPKKRQIIWFLQPHGPWIGEPKLIPEFNKEYGNSFDEMVIPLLRKGKLSLKKFRDAYRGNLRLVLKYVSKLINELPENRKIVITSDHGELLGEYDSFLHYSFLTVPELREVPYFRVK